MRLRQLVLCAGLALALTACGQRESAAERSPAGSPTSASAPTAATQQAAVQQKTAEQTVDLPSKITRMNEDGSETVEDVPSDSGAHNPLLAAVASTVASASAATTSGPTLWQEGVNYTRLVPAQPTAVPHRSLARLYCTLDVMGKLDQLHGEVFKEIHVNGNPLLAADPNNATESERIQTAFVKKFGISESDFKKAYHSLPVDLALQRADQLVQRYRIDGVPTLVVNGKYVADVRSADGQERLMSLVGDLAAQEHKH